MASAVHCVETRTTFMRIKVHGGTPAHDGNSLCNGCRHGRVTRGQRIDEELVLCGASQMVAQRITFKVTSCSDYVDQSVPSYWELMHQAWILRPESGKRPAGFVRASDLRDEEYSRYVSGLGKQWDE
jgi:hypothetical protein